MNFIKKYTPTHYNHFIKKANKIIGKYNNTNELIINSNDNELFIWFKTIKYLNNDKDIYFEECSILLTLIIRLFILELDIDDNKIELTNNKIIELIQKFENIIKIECGYRKNINVNKTNYSLL